MATQHDTNPNAAIIAIGNEILSGKTLDSNSNWIACKLAGHGIRMCEIRVIPDKIDMIISALRELKDKYDFIITTGGIGPTHDDITSLAIARAFESEVQTDSDAYDALLAYYGSEEEMNEGRRKMAKIPQGASLIENPLTAAPGFKIGNVYALAGVPKIMKAMMEFVLEQERPGRPYLSRQVLSPYSESRISQKLDEIQKRYEDIDIGSYPAFENPDYSVRIILRGLSDSRLKAAEKEVQEHLNSIA